MDAQMGDRGDRSDGGKPATDFKVFVGGISWHMDDRELKKSESVFPSTPSRPSFSGERAIDV